MPPHDGSAQARRLLRAESFFEQKSIFDGRRYDPNPQGEYDGLGWAGLKGLSATLGHELRHWS